MGELRLLGTYIRVEKFQRVGDVAERDQEEEAY